MSTIELLGVIYISRESLQEATGCPADTFRRAEAEGLPRIKFAKRVYYPRHEVEAWIARRTHVKAA